MGPWDTQSSSYGLVDVPQNGSKSRVNNQEESHIVYVRFEEWLELIQTMVTLPPREVGRLRSLWNVRSPMAPDSILVESVGEVAQPVVYGNNLSVELCQELRGTLLLCTRLHDSLDDLTVLTVPSDPSPHTPENEVRTCEDLHSTPEAPCQTDTAHVPSVSSIQETLQVLESSVEDLDAVFELLDLQAQRDRAYLESRLDYLETIVDKVQSQLCDKPRKKSKKARASSKTSGRRPVRKGR